MAALVGGVMKAAGAAFDAASDMKLPEGEWTECGPSCSIPCCLTCLPTCSCISVYMTWMKLMPTEAVPRALWQTLANCVGMFFTIVGSALLGAGAAVEGMAFLAVIGLIMAPCFSCCQTWGLYEQRKRLGSWMNMPKEKQEDMMQGVCCHCCCPCFQTGAEGATVDTWLSTYFLMGPALQAAWIAKEKLEGAAKGAGAVLSGAGDKIGM